MDFRSINNIEKAVKQKKATRQRGGVKKGKNKRYWLITALLAVFGAFFLVDIIPAFALPWVILSLFIVLVLKFSHTILLRLAEAV